MKVLLEGSLNQSLQLKDLLSGIFQAEASGLTVLKFTAGKEELGQLYFWGGHYIVYAGLVAKAVDATAALDELLQLKQADFVYCACDSSDQVPPKGNLKIDLKELIESWRQASPVLEGQLLDKIFNFESAGNTTQARIDVLQAEVSATQAAKSGPAESNVTESEPAVATEPSLVPTVVDMDWNLVEPLVSDGAPKPSPDGPGGVAGYQNFTDPNAQKVRVTSLNVNRQQKLRKVVFVMLILLVGIIVIMCCVWLFMTAPSARLRPSRYAVPIQRRNPDRFSGAGNGL